jgi:predicted O-linked N-acetylglucosamine transferase (SPINDLY family)
VLWLLETGATVRANLEREAAQRGVDPARLVFATRAPLAEYLARYALADLFLDTLPYNAGTTANDALGAGLPLLTCAGRSFAGRMAGSVLRAAGLPELVTRSLVEYEALALDLARSPARLADIRRRAGLARGVSALFDCAGFTRNLEDALERMYAAVGAERSS